MTKGRASHRSRRLPRSVEREIAKLLGTLGFRDYGSALWNLSCASEAPASAIQEALASSVSSQILDQARHDPAVTAAGARCMPFLPRRVMSALDQHEINASSLFRHLSGRVQVVVVVPNIERLTTHAALLSAWTSLGARTVAVLVTEQNESPVEAQARDVRARMPGLHLTFWRDHQTDRNANSARLFALFLHALGPAIVLIDQSELGLETIVRYGRALMRFHRLFCVFEVDKDDAAPPIFARFLRAASAHATIVAAREDAASVLERYGADPEGPGLVVYTPSGSAGDESCAADVARTFGDFADGRSPCARSALPPLLRGRPPFRERDRPSTQTRAPAGHLDVSATDISATDVAAIDVTVIIVFHRERELALAALASLSDMVANAREAGLAVEVLAMLDRPDEATRAIVATHGAGLADIEIVDFGDLGLVRNAGADKARGRFCAFVDGDDLWGPRWLSASYRAATSPDAPSPAIWHPSNIYLFYERDFDVHTTSTEPHADARSEHYVHRSCLDPDFDVREALLENPWSANAFAATALFRKFRYRSNDWNWQSGIEDWRWNLETLGDGIPHLTVPETVHIIRVKDTGSLSVRSDARGLLPILT